MKKVFALLMLLVFGLAACQTTDDSPSDAEQRLADAIALIEAAHPLASLTIDLDQVSHKEAALKRALEALEGLAALNVSVAVSHVENDSFEVVVSLEDLTQSTTVEVEAFVLSDLDFAALVADAVALIEGIEDYLELDVSSESNQAREEALKAYFEALPGMSSLGVTIEVAFDEDQWLYDITISRADASAQTSFQNVYFNVVRPITDPTLKAMIEAVKAHFWEQFYPSSPIFEQQLSEMMGVDMAWVDDYYAEGPMFTMNVDMMIGIKAKDGHLNDVESALLAYQDYLINDSFQYPMNMAVVQASKVHVIGDYVFLIVLSQALPDGTEDAVSFYESINQQAINQLEAIHSAN